MVRYFLALFAMISLAGCQTGGGTFCDIAKPLRLSDQAIDAMTDAEVAAALAHNEKLTKLCGVRP